MEKGNWMKEIGITPLQNINADLLEVLKELNAWVGVRLGYEYDEDPVAELVHKAITKAEGKEQNQCSLDHDEEFEAGQRHCRKCRKYLFE